MLTATARHLPGRSPPDSPWTDDAPARLAGTVRIARNARKDTMNNGQNYPSSDFKLNSTPMIIGAALVGAASLIGITGMIVGSSAMFSATRQWFRDQEMPPSDLVKHKWGQTKAATMAGAGAWQHHNNGMRHRTHV
jgi:hypothetical protein